MTGQSFTADHILNIMTLQNQFSNELQRRICLAKSKLTPELSASFRLDKVCVLDCLNQWPLACAESCIEVETVKLFVLTNNIKLDIGVLSDTGLFANQDDDA